MKDIETLIGDLREDYDLLTYDKEQESAETAKIANDIAMAIVLLKEDEPVEPEYKLLPGSTTIHEWDCGNCGYGLFMILSHENRYSAKHAVRYCAGCGRRVKWE